MRVNRLCSLLVLAGCGGGAALTDGTSPTDGHAPARDAARSIYDGSMPFDATTEVDAAAPVDAAPTADQASPIDASSADLSPASMASWLNSLSHCWNDPNCPRLMIVSHGGDWDAISAPYDSRAAMVKAVQNGADAIKGDLRMTRDGIAVVAHSSPIEIWESLDCAGKKIEQMTAAEVTGCHMLPSPTETFQRVDDLLAWARGRTVVMFDVKESADIPAAIATVIASSAEDYVFLEVATNDLLQIAVPAPGFSQVHYLARLGDPSDIPTLVAAMHVQQFFMYELDPTYPNVDATQMKALITTQLHPNGVRAFTSSDKYLPTVQNHQSEFQEGFDVVMSYNLANGVAARKIQNQARGVNPP